MGKDGCSEQLSRRKIFNSDIYLPQYIELQDNLGFMRLRRHPIVIRIHNSKRKEDYEQQYSELVLFAHWRNEAKEFHENNS